MDKKEKIILAIAGAVIVITGGICIYKIISSQSDKKPPETISVGDDAFRAGDYVLHYGHYSCTFEDYADGAITMYGKSLTIRRDEVSFNGAAQSYAVDGNSIKLADGTNIKAVLDDRVDIENDNCFEYNYSGAED